VSSREPWKSGPIIRVCSEDVTTGDDAGDPDEGVVDSGD
jgi:hypothetical protein